MVGVVGTDFPQEHLTFLQGRNIDLRGLQVVEGETFFWGGRYGQDMGDVETLETWLNVFADFHPAVPETFGRVRMSFWPTSTPTCSSKCWSRWTIPG